MQKGNFKSSPENIQKHIRWCIKQFSSKPFSAARCYGEINGRKCPRSVKKLSLYKDTIDPYFWCGKCDPYQSAAPDGALFVVTNYLSALDFAKERCNGDKHAYRKIIDELCRAKGIRTEITDKSIFSFFYE